MLIRSFLNLVTQQKGTDM